MDITQLTAFRIASVVFSKLATISILTTFGAVGYLGHQTHWRFSHAVNDQIALEATSNSLTPSLDLDDSKSLSELGIQLQRATTQHLREEIPAMATVIYNGQRYSQLSTRADGHVMHVFPHIGQPVRKGDILALIDSQVVGDAKSEWIQKVVSARYHQRTLDLLTHAADSVIPQARIRSVEAEARDAELSCFVAQQRLMNLGFVIDFELNRDRSPTQLADQVRFLGVSKELLKQLPTPPTTANLIPIQAPFDGVIVEQHAVAGEMVTTGDYQFIVADTSTMWIKLSVAREDASKLSVGQSVEFLADGIATPMLTKLVWINPEIDAETQTIQAYCEIENELAVDHSPTADQGSNPESSHRVMKANQFGTAKVCVANRPNAVLVPASAIQRMPDQSSVAFVSIGDSITFERRTVQLGIAHNGLVEVLKGIREGELVVSEGSFILKSELMRSSLAGG